MNYIKYSIMNLIQTYNSIIPKIKSSSQIILKTVHYIKNSIFEFNQTYPLIIPKIKNDFQILFQIAHKTFLRLLEIFRIFLTLRVIMTWFPSFNTRRRPFLFIAKLTRVYLGIFRNVCPKFFGIDISSLLAFVWLRTLIRICS
jgi:uncharacterized protein YggT (Ycf19 family)